MLLTPFDDHIQRVLSYWGQFEAELARMSVFVIEQECAPSLEKVEKVFPKSAKTKKNVGVSILLAFLKPGTTETFGKYFL